MGARVTYSGGPTRIKMGEVEEQTWTTIAADTNGVPDAEAIGQQKTTRRTHFAFKAEAEAWLREQAADGWECSGPTPCATAYFGLSDAPSNCWSVEAERAL